MSNKKKSYGPMQSDLAVHLIEKEVVFARDKEGLGTYGMLDDIAFGTVMPYKLIASFSKCKIESEWIGEL